MAFAVSTKAKSVDVGRFLNYMTAIRSITQVTSGDAAVVGTKDALVRFGERLQRMALAGESEYPEDIEAFIPFLVKKEQLYEWLRAESTDPVRPENLYFLISLGGFTAFE